MIIRAVQFVFAVALLCATGSRAGTYSNDFSSGIGAGSIAGNAVLSGEELQLTTNLISQYGTLLLDDLDPGLAIDSFTMTFNLKIDGFGIEGAADGFSVNFANPATFASGYQSYEDGTGTNGLQFRFITYVVNTVVISVNGGGLAGTAPFTSAVMTDGSKQPVTISYNRVDGATLTFRSNTLSVSAAQLAAAGFSGPQAGFKFLFAARTGGGTEVLTLDDVVVKTGLIRYVAPGSPSPTAPFSSWATAAHDIQSAVDAAAAGDLVLVSNGVYATGGQVAAGPTNRVVITKAITVRSVNGPAFTSIVGAKDPLTTNGPAAVRCVYLGQNATLSGFTLTNGATLETGGYGVERSGGGVKCETNAVLTNCTLSGNSASGGGGGAWRGTLNNCTLSGNSALSSGGTEGSTLNHCTLSGNSAIIRGGGASSSALNNCTLAGNTADGEGGGASGSTLINCTLSNNSVLSTSANGGGGVANCNLSNCVLIANTARFGGGSYNNEFWALNNCVLVGNTATSLGGGAIGGTLNNCVLSGNYAPQAGGASSAVLNMCTLSGNSAYFGGGAWSCTLNSCVLTGNNSHNLGGGAYGCTMNNSTLAGNSATNSGGGSYLGELNNCIVYFNTAPSGPNYSGGTFNYSCTTPAPGGAGNITNEPLFVATNNFRLATHSPCVDAGENAYAGSSATDLDGRPRILNGVVDIGAHELTRFFYVATSGSDAASGASWATAKQTIQAAVDLTVDGNTVFVSNGIYATGGRVVSGAMTNRVVITNAITVQSMNGPDFTSIRGAGSNGNAAVRCVYLGSNATLAGFTLTNGATRLAGDPTFEQAGGGAFCAGNATATNCRYANNTANIGGGAYGGIHNACSFIKNSAASGGGGTHSGVLNDCSLLGNLSATGGGGSYSLFNRCILAGNMAVDAGGAYASALNNCLVTSNAVSNTGGGTYGCTNVNCTIVRNSAVLSGGGSREDVLVNSIVYLNTSPTDANCNGPISVSYSCTTPAAAGTGNITNDPQFVSALSNNFRLLAASPCLEAGSNMNAAGPADLEDHPRILNGTVDMGAYERVYVWYVTTNGNDGANGMSWLTAKQNIQSAIDLAEAGQTVVVSNGTYATGGRVVAGALTNRIAITNAITVRSENGPDVTIIQGMGPSGAAAVRCAYVGSNAVLSGFTLTNGATLAAGDLLTEQSGGGAWCENSAVVSNCIVIGNTATNAGGGVVGGQLFGSFIGFNRAAAGGGAYSSTLNACTITNNTATLGNGGGVWSCVLNNCTLAGNAASYNPLGGGDGGGAQSSTLNNCLISGNSAASYGGGANGSTLNNCTITGNTTLNRGGGVYDCTANHCAIVGNTAGLGGGARLGTLNNCRVSGNTAQSGGGAYSSTLNNCTVSGNTASSYEGGGTYNCAHFNSIVYSNTASITGPNYYGGTFTYTCTTPLPAGVGNIDNDPLFVSLATTNLQLAVNSPCINLGNNAFAPGTTDLAGSPRIVNTVVDMGAYEFQGAANPDYDNDGWSNSDEYIAATDPTNSVSFFPTILLTNAPAGEMALIIEPTSTGRVYGVYANTNLLQAPQLWTLVPPEQTGTASALTLTITNTLPGANFRTGVRLP